MAPNLYGQISGPAGFLNNTVVYAYATSRFSAPPEAGTDPPDGAADGTGTSTPTNGGPGQYVIEVAVVQSYYIGCKFPTTPDGGTNASTKWYWTLDQSLVGSGGIVQSITAGVSDVFTNDIEIGGTASDVTLQIPDQLIVYDPTGGGDANDAVMVMGELSPETGIDGYGAAIFSDALSIWQKVQGGPPFPWIFPTVSMASGNVGCGDGEFIRVDTISNTVTVTSPPLSQDPSTFGSVIVAGANTLRLQVATDITLAFSSFPSYGDATIHLVSAAALPSTGGDLYITPVTGTPQYVTYSGKSGNDVTGCTWTGPSGSWGGTAPGNVSGSAAYFTTNGGPQHIIVQGVGAGALFVLEKTHGVWTRVASSIGDSPVFLGNLTVNGTSTLTGAVLASANLDVEANLDVDGTLVVDGTSHLNSTVTIVGNVNQSGGGVSNSFTGLTTMEQLFVGNSALTVGNDFEVDIGCVINLNNHGALTLPQASSAPSYVKGMMYFDTTLNKLRIGGASGWETVTSV